MLANAVGFLIGPAKNMDCQLTMEVHWVQVCLVWADKRLPVEGPLATALPAFEGQRLTAGLRPEGWRVAPATNRNLAAVISHCEVLGNEQLMTCRLLDGNHLVQVRVEPELHVVAGETLHLDPDPKGWRLFDNHGEAIPLPAPSGNGPQLPDLL